MAKKGEISRKGTYTGKIVNTPDGVFMIGNISGYRASGEPVYNTHQFGKLRKDIREKVGELGNNRIKELLKSEGEEYAEGGKTRGGKTSGASKPYSQRFFDVIQTDRKVEVTKGSKSKEIDGADVLDGVYVRKGKYAKGGGVEDIKGKSIGTIIKSGKTKGYSWNDDNGKLIRILKRNDDKYPYAIQIGKGVYPLLSLEQAETNFENLQMGLELDLPNYAKGGGVGEFKVGDIVGTKRFTEGKIVQIDVLDKDVEFDGTKAKIGEKLYKVIDRGFSQGNLRGGWFTSSQIWKYAKGGGVGNKKDITLYRIEKLAKGNKDVLIDKENNLYIYENGVLYDTEDGNKKGVAHRMSKINLTILPFTEYAKGGNVSKLLDVKIKDWYTKNHPKDELGQKINDATFLDLLNALNNKKNIYETIGVGDSFVRERLFDRLSKILDVDYNDIYHKWLESNKYNKGGLVGGWFYSVGGI